NQTHKKFTASRPPVTANTQLIPTVAAMAPPAIGPAELPMKYADEITPYAIPRCAGSVNRPTIAFDTGSTAPTNNPNPNRSTTNAQYPNGKAIGSVKNAAPNRQISRVRR